MSSADTATRPGKSFAQLREVWQSALPRAQKAVLQVLLTYARPDLTVYHSEAELAWACDYTVPTIRAALAALMERQILHVTQGRAPYRATEYQIDLRHLPTRPPYQRRVQSSAAPSTQGSEKGWGPPITANHLPFETENDLPFETANRLAFVIKGQMIDPQTENDLPPRETREADKKKFSHGRFAKTPPPDTVALTDDLRAWAAEHTPGLDLAHERDLWLQHCRAKHYRFADWPEELKGWLLEAYHRATSNGHHRGNLAAPERSPAPTGKRRCGWGGCGEPVCPHARNFCAAHEDCPVCLGATSAAVLLPVPEVAAKPVTGPDISAPDDAQEPPLEARDTPTAVDTLVQGFLQGHTLLLVRANQDPPGRQAPRRRVDGGLRQDGLTLEQDLDYLARMRARKDFLRDQAAQLARLETSVAAD